MNNKPVVNEQGRTCNQCNKFKEWAQYHKNKKGTNGHKTVCRSCKALNLKKRNLELVHEEEPSKRSPIFADFLINRIHLKRAA